MKEGEELHTPELGWGDDLYPLLSWCKQANLKRSKVMVVGGGALGNEVVKNLALFGVGHLVLVDFDEIEYSNLTRSILFSREDAENCRPKVAVLQEKVAAINPDIQVIALACDVTTDVGLGLIKQMNVVIGCVDNRWARYCINRMCMRAGVSWVDGGIDGLEGTARVFRPGENCYACNLGTEALKDLSRRMSCAAVMRRDEAAKRVPTTPVVASIIGAVEVQEAVKLLHPEEMERGELTSLCGKMFYYEGQHLTSRLVDFKGYDDDCPVHESWLPVVLSDLTTDVSVGETLRKLKALLGVRQVQLELRDHSFVTHLVRRDSDEVVMTLCPSFRLQDLIENDETLRYLPSGMFYLDEKHEIDEDFSHLELTLNDMGFPAWSILPVNTEKGLFYVEMSDECHYLDVLNK